MQRIEELYFGEENNTLYVRAVGHITANSCRDLKHRVNARLEHDPQVRELIVDLSSCEYMDSTFMGLLIGFNKRLRKLNGHVLELLRPTESCRLLLSGLGILPLLKILEDNVAVPHDMIRMNNGSETELDMVLSAHDELIELNEANRAKFALVRKILAEQAKKLEH